MILTKSFYNFPQELANHRVNEEEKLHDSDKIIWSLAVNKFNSVQEK